MELQLATPPGGAQIEPVKLKVSERAFGQDYNEPLVHQVVNAYLAGARSGNSAQKNRSEVRGGGAKPWRQKGSGRARAGTIRSPIWRGGGVVFAAKPRDYAQKVNRKMYRGAMRSILSELIRQDRLLVVENMDVEHPKTKLLAKKLNEYDLKDVLIIVDTWSSNLHLASRNLPKVDVRQAGNVNPVCLIRFSKVLITAKALKHLEEVLQ